MEVLPGSFTAFWTQKAPSDKGADTLHFGRKVQEIDQ